MAQSAITQHPAVQINIPTQPTAANRRISLKPGYRLVPTLIGRPDNAATVWIECPTWCTLDHANDRQVAVEDVWHSGDFIDLEMPHQDGTELLAYFRLGLDPCSDDPAKRRPFVYGEDGDSATGRHMSAEDIREFCARMERTAAQLRMLADAVDATSGDSDPDMDEALRRARGGRA